MLFRTGFVKIPSPLLNLVEYSKALAIDATLTAAYNNRGVLLAKQGLVKKAWQDFKQVLVLDPINDEALFNLELIKDSR